MPRRRVAVALIPPRGLAASVQTLRRSLDDERLDALPPHLTLIPPINLHDEALAQGLELLRTIAVRQSTFELELGPAATFAPATPTLHLEVDGALEELHQLRTRLRTGPFERPDVWSFHPHVTLREELAEPARSGAIEALSGRLGPWKVDRVFLLEQLHADDGRRHWVPVVDEPFGAPTVVGRGGIELHLRATSLVPEGLDELLGDSGRPPIVAQGERLVVAATAPGTAAVQPPVGVAIGEVLGAGAPDPSVESGGAVAQLHAVVVDPEQRRLGIGRQVLRRWCHESALRGARVVVYHGDVTWLPEGEGRVELEDLLTAEGFVAVGSTHVRQLVSE